ncbi:hypothetical protein CAPTEDRAFT_227655 [Capitella teleta]|uniref:RING-type domain-containing protein n=1 Tax=Capitella teleta TaxID=283909 RepID=R7TQG9_CAPTE|nr:hypothetical protein CAPTEDRAFT_227655 [Capitella teleta]|eukprot:ELT95899.1 hypothetical protein CAPTEDRAFT_227655 [Capitella teleta]
MWLYVLLSSVRHSVLCDDGGYRGFSMYETYSAVMNITYIDPRSNKTTNEQDSSGRYSKSSPVEIEFGRVVHVLDQDKSRTACKKPINAPKGRVRWIALIQKGGCKLQQKIRNVVLKNASAVVIYETQNGSISIHETSVDFEVSQVVSIFISKSKGQHIASLVDNGTKVMMHISVGRQQTTQYSSINKTSVLFVSISFIVLMIISLAWLVFYYIQRFRYAHAKERLSKRLMNAAKKAITKMPVRTIKNGDKETDSDFDQCAVCIESYRASDVIRILPCKHMFHKSCVDPWLIEQRSCPMCKLDILKAYGLQVHGSHDSMVNIEIEGPSTSIGPSELVPAENAREIGTSPVEVIRYQPAQVEYHDIPSESTSSGASMTSPAMEEEDDEEVGRVGMVKESDGEPHELQSLMQGASAQGTPPTASVAEEPQSV